MVNWLLSRVSVLLIVACSAVGASDFKTYTSPNGDFSVRYPSTWVHYPDAKSLYILNFPLERMVREVLLPEHGAMITFASAHPKPKSLEEWIGNDIKRRNVIERRTFAVERQEHSTPLSVTEIISHSTRGPHEFEEVDWYFSIEGRLFDAVLLYHSGDTAKGKYEQVLREIVSSIKVNP